MMIDLSTTVLIVVVVSKKHLGAKEKGAACRQQALPLYFGGLILSYVLLARGMMSLNSRGCSE